VITRPKKSRNPLAISCGRIAQIAKRLQQPVSGNLSENLKFKAADLVVVLSAEGNFGGKVCTFGEELTP
jgi:hypothetical protein